ncbi:sigma-70 family RNA polymerase sigma factor [uncultured Brevundimonas sp.]|uniref:RNA polymerase sigma factor n=1 Tax=uncultured Brevundimonas sp. TaxID=213418 RepID=UPI0025EC5B40|nr:sigma-70 family RNA polymerase sigma factor [uncultured Brevundimonas sp.]
MNASSGPPQHDPSRPARQALADAWLDSRPALVRFLTARTGSSAAAEDLAQDVWVRLQSMTEEAAAEVRHPQAFLYRIAANLALDASKAQRRAGARDLEWRRASAIDDAAEAQDAPSAEDAVWARLKLEKVVAAIDRMPPKAAEAFRLHKMAGISQAEVAERMGVSRSAVEKYVSASLKELLLRVGWP